MKISIIIPTFSEVSQDYVKMTVESIKKYSTEEHEIIVVSNPDPFYEIPIDGIKRLHSPSQGQCAAVNLGVREATNEYVLISDDDVVFPPNWEELIEKAKEVDFLSGVFMERGQGVPCDPYVIYNPGDTPATFRWEEFEQKAIELAEPRWENGFGFPLLFKKSLWEEIEGYDENYDPWGSNCDSDLEYKLMLRGIMPMRWRGVVTYHFACVSGTFTRPEAQPYWHKNTNYFSEKWGITRARIPAIWHCDFKIDGKTLRYKPSWAKLLGNPNINL